MSLAVSLLQRLIRHDTVNPPGNERVLQEELAHDLRAAGFEIALVGADDERPNLVATLRGDSPGPVLGLLSHVDTVLADPDEWQRDPWSGDLAGKEIWGRGAQDMKSQTAAEVAAAIDLAQGGWRPASGELKLIACVDEETGGALGAQWLCENEPDLARCDYLINEGAGAVMPWDKERLYGVCTAEKGVFRFTLTAHGEAGHASMPGVADNALPKLGAALIAFATNRPSYDLTEAPTILFDALGVEGLETLRARDPKLAAFVEPMASVTFAPTMISASEKINVIPSRATLRVDCRVPPGLGEETARRRIAEVLGSLDGYELEFTERVVGNSSPADTVLFDAIDRWVSGQDKNGKAVPTMLPAFTDSRWFRDAFPDIVAYGFFPQRQMTLYESWPLVHGKDERIAVADVELAADAYAAIARDLLGAGPAAT